MKKNQHGFAKGLAVSLAVFAMLFTGGMLLIDAIGSGSTTEETELVRDAVHNAVLTCYAVEGSYPDTLEYLKEHYGLAYNEDEYLVTYDAFASNIMPEISVFERGQDE